MQIVIDIDEETLQDLYDSRYVSQHIKDVFRSGTPLSKGHKVIDAYALQEHLALVPMEDRTYREAVEIIDRFPSIIEADRRIENGKRRSESKVDLLSHVRQEEMRKRSG